MAKRIDQRRCSRCGACLPVCPNDGIEVRQGAYIIHSEFCTDCYGIHPQAMCADVCPDAAVVDVAGIPESEPIIAERAAFQQPHLFPRD